MQRVPPEGYPFQVPPLSDLKEVTLRVSPSDDMHAFVTVTAAYDPREVALIIPTHVTKRNTTGILDISTKGTPPGSQPLLCTTQLRLRAHRRALYGELGVGDAARNHNFTPAIAPGRERKRPAPRSPPSPPSPTHPPAKKARRDGVLHSPTPPETDEGEDGAPPSTCSYKTGVAIKPTFWNMRNRPEFAQLKNCASNLAQQNTWQNLFALMSNTLTTTNDCTTEYKFKKWLGSCWKLEE